MNCRPLGDESTTSMGGKRKWLWSFLAMALILAAATAGYVAYVNYETRKFVTRVLEYEPKPGQPAKEALRRLGEPDFRERGGDFAFARSRENHDCSKGKARERWIYWHRKRGFYRIFYFDGAGRFICNESGILYQHLWH